MLGKSRITGWVLLESFHSSNNICIFKGIHIMEISFSPLRFIFTLNLLAYIHVFVLVNAGAHGGQKRVLSPLERES